jgi:hypothetical protein
MTECKMMLKIIANGKQASLFVAQTLNGQNVCFSMGLRQPLDGVTNPKYKL